jgi:hypothetical protein
VPEPERDDVGCPDIPVGGEREAISTVGSGRRKTLVIAAWIVPNIGAVQAAALTQNHMIHLNDNLAAEWMKQ